MKGGGYEIFCVFFLFNVGGGCCPTQEWRETDDLLFKGMARVQMSDRGDNWNERWQGALSLPNNTPLDKSHR